jgi:hypothetical protein
MIVSKIFDGSVTTHTPLGKIDLSGYSRYSVLLRVDNAKSNTDPFRFTTYDNNIQVYQHEFTTTGGWHTHSVIHEIFHPSVSFILYNWNNQATVKLWLYATCCSYEEVKEKRKVVQLENVKFTDLGVIE